MEPATNESASLCDRACLEGLVERYLAALVAGDPSSLTVSDGARFVENSQLVAPGDGAWQTIDGLGRYRHVISDPDTGQVAFFGVVTENGRGTLLTLRLRIDDAQRITEAEATVIRSPQGAETYETLGEPDALWLEIVPESDRLDRATLIATADRYFSSMERNDGRGDYSFFHDDCDRWEHGLKTTNNDPLNYGHSDDRVFVTLTCREQFETGFLGFVTRLRDRRFPVVDLERQVVFTHVALDHEGTIRSIPLTDGRTFEIPPYFSVPRSLMVGEAFKIIDGQLRLIEMTLMEPPYGMRPAFDATNDSGPLSGAYPGSAAPADAAEPCDRGCLEQIGARVLDAMVANRPADAPLAPGARYSENDQWLDIGDGLWGTLTALRDQSLWVVDEAAGQIGWLGTITEHDVNGILALRLAVESRLVNDIEVVVVREEIPGHDTLFRPRLLVEPHPDQVELSGTDLTEPLPENRRVARETLAGAADRWFDALLAGRSDDLDLSANCVRTENGMRVTDNPDFPSAAAATGDGGADATAATMWGETTAAGVRVLDADQPDFNPFALGCAAQIDTGLYSYVREIRDRRVWLVDEARGLAFAIGYFDIPGTVRALDVPGVGRVRLPEELHIPYTLASPQLIRLDRDGIQRIDSIARSLPYRIRPTR
jgi:hypothetical protein